MKKFLIASVMFLCSIFSANAVLQEQDLKQTVAVLHAELQQKLKEQEEFKERYGQMNEMQHQQIIEIMQKSNQIALMLYSQQSTYTFDLAYACHEATAQYTSFTASRAPHAKIINYLDIEITRYQNLISALKNLPPRIKSANDTMPKPKFKMDTTMRNKMKRDTSYLLSAQGRVDRDSCIAYANKILTDLQELKEKVQDDNEHYEFVSKRLKASYDYATTRYNDLQQNIFKNGDTNYFSILSHLPMYVQMAGREFRDKYFQANTTVKSGWRGGIVFGLIIFVTFYLIISALMGLGIIKLLVPFIVKTFHIKKIDQKEFKGKQPCLVMAVGVFIFAISIMIVKTMMEFNFFIMASSLLIEYAWLLGVILLSLLIRLNSTQIKKGFRIYTPIIVMGFIVIVFRIMFIPNTLISLVFPPILLLFTIWQWLSVRNLSKELPKSDIFYTQISLLAMGVSCICSFAGYTLLSVQIFIWWLFQLTFIQTITCIYDLLDGYEKNVLIGKTIAYVNLKRDKKTFEKKLVKLNSALNNPKLSNAEVEEIKEDLEKLKANMPNRNTYKIDLKDKKNKGAYIKQTWLFDLVNTCIVPVFAALSVFFSIYWAADLFNLTEFCKTIFFTNFVNVPDVIQLSIFKITIVIALFFIFRYTNYIIKNMFRAHIESNKENTNGSANISLFNSVSGIIIWGTYFVIFLFILQVPKSGISLVTAGLATGVGFAMKDLLENLFYGISLMTGRIKVGDWVECDGIRGKVESISYQSTQIETADGCVISFLNGALLSKNFKNLTKNHGYELVKIPFGVAYGTKPETIREIVCNAVEGLRGKYKNTGKDNMDKTKPVSVLMDDMADSSVNYSAVVWMLVEAKFTLTGQIKETIYDALTDANIEIPFPQRDIHIRKD